MINIIEENSEIPEMYELRNKHNTYIKEHGYDYSSNLFKRSLSKVLFKNKKMSEFLDSIEKMTLTIYDSTNKVRNLFYFTHNKYYNKHGK